MNSLYTFSILVYTALIHLASFFNSKAKDWVSGRKDQFVRLSEKAGAAKISEAKERVWIHCASLGEFEQGRPLIELIRKEKPETKIILTFFSPSGYEIRKDYSQADIVTYLPADLPSQTKRFLDIIRPTKVVFVKYEFWFNYLKELQRRSIPHYLVSGIFRTDQIFFKWYSKWFRNILGKYTYFFLQEERSKELLGTIDIVNTTVTGDTRFDRVHQLAKEEKADATAELFCETGEVMVAGSTWEKDEEVISAWIIESKNNLSSIKLILAPHEISEDRLRSIEKRFAELHPIRHSTGKNDPRSKLLLIDHIGKLSLLYKYGKYTYVGGGFGKGIHNILEAAVYGKPVIFGPNFYKFQEAVDLLKAGGAFSISSVRELSERMEFLRKDPLVLQMASMMSKEFVLRRTGATATIYHKIFTQE